MKIYMTMVQHKYERTLELVHAWDEYAMDENRGGYVQSQQDAIAKYGDDITGYRVFIIDADDETMVKAFEPMLLKGKS